LQEDQKMAHVQRDGYGSSDASPERKNGYNDDIVRSPSDDGVVDTSHHLHRGLKARQITMIAIGGAIGTGLIIGT
jgi:amino acid transporter